MNYFYYAFKIKDITTTIKLHTEILGCGEGRLTDSWTSVVWIY